MSRDRDQLRPQSLPDLPAWLEALLPEPREPMVMSVVDEGTLRLRFPDGRIESFDTLPEAHRAALDSDLDLFVEDNVYEALGDDRSRRHRLLFGYPSEGNDGYTTMVMSYTDDDRHAGLRAAYEAFLDAAAEYVATPGDFPRAWRFIDQHPAFWTAPNLDQHPWLWETSGYCSRITQFVRRHEEELGQGGVGPALVSLDAGGHVPEDTGRGTRYRDHYADWRLEVTAHSFEEAILLLAERVEMCFDHEGNPKSEDQINLPVPDWVQQLKSRVADVD